MNPLRLNPFRRLREHGILGMNERNAAYIQEFNPRALFPLVDDKLLTKRLAEKAGIAVPRLLGEIQMNHQMRDLDRLVGEAGDFVIKPAQGSGGNDILVVGGRFGGHFRRLSGVVITRDEIRHQVANILSGMHSLRGLPDRALIEERVRFDTSFDDVSYQGVPDIRTVVYRGVPVVAMIRLPTRGSDGKANLHLGGVGVGVDIATGRTLGAIRNDRPVTHHPDTLHPLTGLDIPGWNDLLVLAARCQALCNLGYLGVDVVLDRDRGPLVLELNARPGLSVQLANGVGLRHRLRRIDRLEHIPEEAEARAALSRDLFGSPLATDISVPRMATAGS